LIGFARLSPPDSRLKNPLLRHNNFNSWQKGS
jgi:hypothetical protein